MCKRAIGILLALCLGVAAGGCQKQNPSANPPDIDPELCSISSDGQMAETGGGYYFCALGTLYYADKGDLDNWVPVCNQPDCTHDGPDCPANVAREFYLAGDRIYTIRNTWDFDTTQESREMVYSMALDGSDLRPEYEIAGSVSSLGGMEMSILRPGEVLDCYSALQPDGNYLNQIIRADPTGTQTLFTDTTTDLSIGFFLPASRVFCMRGDFALCCDWLAGQGQGMEHLYSLSEEGLVEIPGICDYDLFGAYLQGDELRRFVPDDGYYTTSLTGNTSEKTMDAQLTGSVAYHLTGQYIVETNLMFRAMPEEPEMRLYDGSSWHEINLPDTIQIGEETAYPFIGISSEYIFFSVNEGGNVYLYGISLNDPGFPVISCGEFGEISSNG